MIELDKMMEIFLLEENKNMIQGFGRSPCGEKCEKTYCLASRENERRKRKKVEREKEKEGGEREKVRERERERVERERERK